MVVLEEWGEECKTLDEGTAAQKHTDGEQELIMSHRKFEEVSINGQLLKNDGWGRLARGEEGEEGRDIKRRRSTF